MIQNKNASVIELVFSMSHFKVRCDVNFLQLFMNSANYKKKFFFIISKLIYESKKKNIRDFYTYFEIKYFKN